MAEKELSPKEMKETKGGLATSDARVMVKPGEQPASTLVPEPAAADQSIVNDRAKRVE
jgi:hypothetical protein